MEYEQAYLYAVSIAEMYLNEEEGVASNMPDHKTIYDVNHPLYSLMAFPYGNLFLEDGRDSYDKVCDNEIRTQQLVRIRGKAFTVVSLTGIEFVKKFTDNMIDGLIHNAHIEANKKKSQVLRRELETFFNKRPDTWFCVLASCTFNNRMVAHSHAVRQKLPSSLGTALRIHNASAGQQSRQDRRSTSV